MPQTICPPLSGVMLAANVSTGGQVRILTGSGDPNLAATDNANADIANSSIGSIFLRMDAPDSTHALYVKTAQPGTWTAK